MKPRPVVVAALAACALLAGCTWSVQRAGDARFLEREHEFVPGVTRARDVAAALGPPDRIHSSKEELVFVYRFRREVQTSFVIAAYMKLFTREQGRRSDATLVAVFDADDRLLYWGTSGSPQGRHPASGESQ